MAEPTVTIFGPLDALLAPGNRMAYVVLVLVVASLVTRKLAQNSHRRQAAEGEDATLSRYTLHSVTSGLLVLSSFYYTTLHAHSGIVLSTLVLALFFADFFEFEARRVEVREGLPLGRPTGAIAASALVLLYSGYLSLFFVIAPIWNKIV